MFEVGKKYTIKTQPTIFTCIAVHNHTGWMQPPHGYPKTGLWDLNEWSEYKEPHKISGWMNLYEWKGAPDPGNYVYTSKAEALARAQTLQNRGYVTHLATIYVSGEEGKEPC